MSREYIPKVPYIRKEVWKRITSVIRDYQRLNDEYAELISNETRDNYIRENELRRKLEAFEKAFYNSDDEVRQLIQQRFWEQRTYRDIFIPMSERTMQRYIRQFVIEVGRNLGEIE